MERATAREAHERIMAKYNVSFDNHVEDPEILQVEAVQEAAAEAEKEEKKSSSKKDKKSQG